MAPAANTARTVIGPDGPATTEAAVVIGIVAAIETPAAAPDAPAAIDGPASEAADTAYMNTATTESATAEVRSAATKAATTAEAVSTAAMADCGDHPLGGRFYRWHRSRIDWGERRRLLRRCP